MDPEGTGLPIPDFLAALGDTSWLPEARQREASKAPLVGSCLADPNTLGWHTGSGTDKYGGAGAS